MNLLELAARDAAAENDAMEANWLDRIHNMDAPSNLATESLVETVDAEFWNLMQPVYIDQCQTWVDGETPLVPTDNPPCTYIQAVLDPAYEFDPICVSSSGLCEYYQQGAANCVRSASPE